MECFAKRILVAEDNNALANVIRFNLEQAGFDVSVARDGGEAMELLRALHFDAVITDYQMPSLSGEDLCRFVRETMQNIHLPIVMCSAKGYELDCEALRARWKVEKVIFKPFSLREVVRLIRKLTSSPTVANP